MELPLIWHELDEVREASALVSPRNLKTNALESYAQSIPQDVDDAVYLTKAVWDPVTQQLTCSNNPYTVNIPLCTYIDIAYDQLNRLNAMWVDDGKLYLYWYDSNVASFVTTDFGAVDEAMFLMDDVRNSQQEHSTLMVFYTRELALYYRMQLDRFTIEYPIAIVEEGSRFVNAGINTRYRMQLMVLAPSYSELTDYIIQVDDSYVMQDIFYLGENE